MFPKPIFNFIAMIIISFRTCNDSFGFFFQFVLKHDKFKSIREVPKYPMALCPSNEGKTYYTDIYIEILMHPTRNIRNFSKINVHHIPVYMH